MSDMTGSAHQNKQTELDLLKKELEFRDKQLKLIKEAVQEVITELDFHKLINSIAGKAKLLVNADTVVVPIINKQHTHYTYKAARGKNAELMLNQSFPVSIGMCGWVLSNEEPLFFSQQSEWMMGEKTRWEDGMESALLVPLKSRGKIVGGLSALGKKDSDGFNQQDYELLSLFASHISVAIDNAQIFEELKAEKEYSETTLNSIGDAVITTDSEGRIQKANPVATMILACEEKDILGKLAQDIFKTADSTTHEPLEDPVAKVLRTKTILNSEGHTTLISGNGSEYQISNSAAPIRDSRGNIQGVILVFRDITERQQTEEALRRSQKMDAIGQLSGGIAHDFNNQLSVIIGYLDMLKDSYADNVKPRRWVETATQATQRCMDLTRQLLAFSRHHGEQALVTNINEIIEDQKNLFARTVTPKIDVQYFLANDLWLSKIDSSELQSALLNLVINARDAMPDGGKIIIETSNKQLDESYAALDPGLKAGDYVQLMLSDTGNGMDRETLEHIFEPFFTTKAEGKGTGLGMAMVYGFVKRYGGHIRVYSEPGKGTTIRLYLPRSTTSGPTARRQIIRESKLATGNETILIVDDEIDLLQLANQYLSSLGYRTLLAESASQAMEIVANERDLDLLFSDVVMPGEINGYQLAQQVTQQRPALKVLLTSGFTAETVQHSGLARFTAHMLSKPYRKADLARHIREVLDDGIPQLSSTVSGRNSDRPLIGCTILVVDDEEDIRDLYQLNLDKLGYKTILASEGEEAVKRYRQALESNSPIDAVIMDLGLPGGMDGKQVAANILSLDPGARIIVASGHTQGPEMTHYQDYGFCATLEKDFNRENMRRVLEQVITSA